MNYIIDKDFKLALSQSKVYLEMINKMEMEALDYVKSFRDSCDNLSGWGHQYFCEKDGGKISFDINSSHQHSCEICGQEYLNHSIYDSVWLTHYRNLAFTTLKKLAVLYKATGEKKYIENFKTILEFYVTNYEKFPLHDKTGKIFLEREPWGCGKVMPQGLNEAIIAIRACEAVEMIKEDLGVQYIEYLHQEFFKKIFKLLRSQTDRIHNIVCWINSAIGIMGFVTNDKEMVDHCFKGKFNINEQLRQGVTKDFFWYEGSIHYNFFTLEGVLTLGLFTNLYLYPFEQLNTLKEMIKSSYYYAFDSGQLPNPNDGWPNINLTTYEHIFTYAARIFSDDLEVVNILKNIINDCLDRVALPLSDPYFYNNDIPLERLSLIPLLNRFEYQKLPRKSLLFEDSNSAIIRQNDINIFIKFGHKGPSHAHFDKMNVEYVINNESFSRDLSNSGYGATLCNEWHRMTSAHNTVAINGLNQRSYQSGKVLEFNDKKIIVECLDVYSDEGKYNDLLSQGKINYRRQIEINNEEINDIFYCDSLNEVVFDYFFHVEAELITKNLNLIDSDLGFKSDGYQHLKDVKKLESNEKSIKLLWQLKTRVVEQEINLDNHQLFIAKSYDNPITSYRTAIILRSYGKNAIYRLRYEIKEKEI